MRWYCVLFFRAAALKNATLRLLKAIVTLMPSSRNTRSSGRGRKSGTTLIFPRGSFVYLIFAFIDHAERVALIGLNSHIYVWLDSTARDQSACAQFQRILDDRGIEYDKRYLW